MMQIDAAAEVEPLDPDIFGEASPCFGCAPHHPIGFKLRFERIGEVVRTRFTPDARYQGPPGIFHDGLVTTLADEIAAWTVLGLRHCFGFTAALSGRLVHPVRIEDEVVGLGRIEADRRRLLEIEVELQQAGRVAFRGSFTFALLDEAGATRLLGELPEAWKPFCRR
ncbi:MAG: hotdog domain-containing protein [Myxococcota bacterium]